MSDQWLIWCGIGLLVLASAIGAMLVKWAKCPGWPIVGGVIVGVVLGPTIFGRVAPDLYERMYAGGTEQRQERDLLISRQGADLLVAQRTIESEAQRSERNERHESELADANDKLRAARWADQRNLRAFVFLIIGITLLGAGARSVPQSAQKQNLITPVSVGLGAFIVPGALAFVAMTSWWGFGLAEAALVASAVAIGPWAFTKCDREAADQAELGGAQMLQSAGRIASILSIGVVFLVMWNLKRAEGVVFALPLLALPISWLIPWPKALTGRRQQDGIYEYVVIPALAASIAIQIELFEHFSFWPIIIMLLLSDDGRWIGAFFGAMILGGRNGLRTMRLVLGSMAAGPTQLAIIAFAVHTRSIPDELVLALLLGAVLIEVTAPARRSMAKRIVRAEQEIDEITRE